MSEAERAWRLVRGRELIAELVVTGGDFPWLSGTVLPATGFAEVRPLFEDDLRRLDRLDSEPELWEAAHRRIRDQVQLLAPDGRPVPEFLLHIEDEDAWWQWSHEPSQNGEVSCNSHAASATIEYAAEERDTGPWPGLPSRPAERE